ncbi:MAG: TetR/AcrR family transcriptional regulator [Clostridia bacterium]|nr:TetR/AcrR family transcriptional regulator [Clostridia bacterium]
MAKEKLSSESSKNARELILETAAQVFADKGFDGARVDEIAAKAGIPKSLIYYHFKGKDQLLEELLEMFFKSYRNILREKSECGSGSSKYNKFLTEHSDLLRVVMIESLKKNTKIPTVFRIVEILLEFEKEIYGETDQNREEKHKRLVAEFFTSALPMAGFACYSDAWCDYFKVDKKELYADFADAMQKTHGEYHKKQE